MQPRQELSQLKNKIYIEIFREKMAELKYTISNEFCDVLIIGSGGAGIRAALEAFNTDKNLKVCIVTKGNVGKSGVTANAFSDRMAFHATLPTTLPAEKNNWTYHASDIYKVGGKVSDFDLAEILAKNSEDAFHYLDKIGVPFVKDENTVPIQFKTDGSEYPRACYTGPGTANDIEKALVKELMNTDISIIEDTMLVDLIVKESRVIGALCIKEQTDAHFIYFQAKTVILCTGGGGSLFRINLFPEGMTGDGYAAALRGSAELVNMEFIQIGLASVKTKLACSGSIMRAVPRMINEKGEEILNRYFNLSPGGIGELVFNKGDNWPVRDDAESSQIDVSLFREISGGSRIFLDFSRNPEGFLFSTLPEDLKRKYYDEIEVEIDHEKRNLSPLNRLKEINSKVVAWLSERGINLQKGDLLEIAPAVQHFQGGIKINENAESSVCGLYAVGECAGGQHGANRPGGNALLDCQVFGKIAGYQAAINSKKIPFEKINIEDYIQRILIKLNQNNNNGDILRQDITKIMYRYGTVVRSDESIKIGLKKLEQLERAGINIDEYPLHKVLETRNMLNIGKAILLAALMRKESRGPHLCFSTYENETYIKRKGKEWEKYIIIKMTEGKILSVLQKTNLPEDF